MPPNNSKSKIKSDNDPTSESVASDDGRISGAEMIAPEDPISVASNNSSVNKSLSDSTEVNKSNESIKSNEKVIAVQNETQSDYSSEIVMADDKEKEHSVNTDSSVLIDKVDEDYQHGKTMNDHPSKEEKSDDLLNSRNTLEDEPTERSAKCLSVTEANDEKNNMMSTTKLISDIEEFSEQYESNEKEEESASIASKVTAAIESDDNKDSLLRTTSSASSSSSSSSDDENTDNKNKSSANNKDLSSKSSSNPDAKIIKEDEEEHLLVEDASVASPDIIDTTTSEGQNGTDTHSENVTDSESPLSSQINTEKRNEVIDKGVVLPPNHTNNSYSIESVKSSAESTLIQAKFEKRDQSSSETESSSAKQILKSLSNAEKENSSSNTADHSVISELSEVAAGDPQEVVSEDKMCALSTEEPEIQVVETILPSENVSTTPLSDDLGTLMTEAASYVGKHDEPPEKDLKLPTNIHGENSGTESFRIDFQAEQIENDGKDNLSASVDTQNKSEPFSESDEDKDSLLRRTSGSSSSSSSSSSTSDDKNGDDENVSIESQTDGSIKSTSGEEGKSIKGDKKEIGEENQSPKTLENDLSLRNDVSNLKDAYGEKDVTLEDIPFKSTIQEDEERNNNTSDEREMSSIEPLVENKAKDARSGQELSKDDICSFKAFSNDSDDKNEKVNNVSFSEDGMIASVLETKSTAEESSSNKLPEKKGKEDILVSPSSSLSSKKAIEKDKSIGVLNDAQEFKSTTKKASVVSASLLSGSSGEGTEELKMDIAVDEVQMSPPGGKCHDLCCLYIDNLPNFTLLTSRCATAPAPSAPTQCLPITALSYLCLVTCVQRQLWVI